MAFHLNGHTLGFHPQTQRVEQDNLNHFHVSERETAKILNFIFNLFIKQTARTKGKKYL